MTDTDDILKAMLDQLEPSVVAFADRSAVSRTERAAYSQAVSLKRIADALEKLAAARPPTEGGPMPDWRQHPDQSDQPFAPLQGSGWNAWAGGECPVPRGTLVDVRFRDGWELHGAEAQRTVAGRPRNAAFWNQDNSSDIIAWRLAK